MMKSDGGAASATMLAQVPIATVMSGPVAGVIGGRYLGDVKGIDNLITFDTGGTSRDKAVLPGPPPFQSEGEIARHPLRAHPGDIQANGAGCGRQARPRAPPEVAPRGGRARSRAPRAVGAAAASRR